MLRQIRQNSGKGRAPIEKNIDSEKRTVRVLGADGETIGSTYPKRAAGLVKKGRARYVSDRDIRLNVSDVMNFTEETKMDNINNLGETKEIIAVSAESLPASAERRAPEQPVNRLFFSAREWAFNKACKDNVGSRSFMEGPDGVIAEAYTIGNWSWNWTEILSRALILPKNTLHTFTFWLNGGENDRNNEVCRFEIVFNNDHENRYTYNLNRNFVKPLKKVNGWELYEIPFITGNNEYTELRFVAQNAPMTVLTAKDKSAYAGLADTVDEFEGERPQRHNIVFDDGWPNDNWYSTKNLRAQREKRMANGQNAAENNAARNVFADMRFDFAEPRAAAAPDQPNLDFISGKMDEVSGMLDGVSGTLGGVPGMVSGMLGGLINGFFANELREKVEAAIKLCGTGNTGEIIDMVMESLNDRLDGLTESIENNIETMTDQIEAMIDDVGGRLDDVQNAVEVMQDAVEQD